MNIQLLTLLTLIVTQSLLNADCSDKLAHCAKGGYSVVNQKWNWAKARCMPCLEGCGHNYADSEKYCSDKGGIDRLADLSEQAILDQELKTYQEAYNNAYKKCETYMSAAGERDFQLSCPEFAKEVATEAIKK